MGVLISVIYKQTKHIQSFTEIAVIFSVIKKEGVSIFYSNFVARKRKGLERETSHNRLERAVTGLNNP